MSDRISWLRTGDVTNGLPMSRMAKRSSLLILRAAESAEASGRGDDPSQASEVVLAAMRLPSRTAWRVHAARRRLEWMQATPSIECCGREIWT